MTREKTKEVLNQAVADLSQLSAFIHQIHWYMRGEDFLTLHPKMDELRDQVEEQLDEIAERLIILGGSPYSTLAEFVEKSSITFEKGSYDLTMKGRLQALVSAFQLLVGVCQAGLTASGEDGDDVTNDIFVGTKAWYEKQIWMLQAELGMAPGLEE